MTAKLFTLQVPDAAIADLRERLARTRLPDEPPLPPWSTGTSVAYLKSLLGYWQNGFDWRAWEGKLNSFPQFTLPIRGIDLHFIRAPSQKPGAPPLLLSHGWPGSVFEFHKIIPLLTEHFTVIAPSLPGYTLSFKPGQQRFGIVEIADPGGGSGSARRSRAGPGSSTDRGAAPAAMSKARCRGCAPIAGRAGQAGWPRAT